MTVLGNHNNQKSTLTFSLFSLSYSLSPSCLSLTLILWMAKNGNDGVLLVLCVSLKACNFHITALYATYRQLIGSLTLPFALAHTEISLSFNDNAIRAARASHLERLTSDPDLDLSS